MSLLITQNSDTYALDNNNIKEHIRYEKGKIHAYNALITQFFENQAFLEMRIDIYDSNYQSKYNTKLMSFAKNIMHQDIDNNNKS